MSVKHAVQAAGFVLVAEDTVFDLLGCIAEEVVCLSLHWTHARVQEEEPVVDFIALARPGRVGDLVVYAVVLLDEVLHYAPRFEQTNCFAIGEGVGEGGYATIGVDGEEEGFFLGILRYIDCMGFVGDAGEMGRMLVRIVGKQTVYE